jgi:hypothetical protein
MVTDVRAHWARWPATFRRSSSARSSTTRLPLLATAALGRWPGCSRPLTRSLRAPPPSLSPPRASSETRPSGRLRSHSVQSLEEPEKAKVLAEALMQAQTSSPRTVVTAFAPVAGALPDDVFVAILDALQEAIAAAASLRPRERDEVLQELASSFRGQAWWEALALAKLPFHSGVPDRSGASMRRPRNSEAHAAPSIAPRRPHRSSSSSRTFLRPCSRRHSRRSARAWTLEARTVELGSSGGLPSRSRASLRTSSRRSGVRRSATSAQPQTSGGSYSPRSRPSYRCLPRSGGRLGWVKPRGRSGTSARGSPSRKWVRCSPAWPWPTYSPLACPCSRPVEPYLSRPKLRELDHSAGLTSH